MKAQDTVYSAIHGKGTIQSIDGSRATVQLESGETKVLLVSILSATAPKVKAKKQEIEVKVNFNGIVNQIKGDSQMRGHHFAFGTENIFTQIEKKAFDAGHFAGDIITKARNGAFITDKQAVAVAMFAKANGMV